MVSRGKFIVFEGCDRSGKTTQCYMVVEALKKKNLLDEYIKFPGMYMSFVIFFGVKRNFEIHFYFEVVMRDYLYQ